MGRLGLLLIAMPLAGRQLVGGLPAAPALGSWLRITEWTSVRGVASEHPHGMAEDREDRRQILARP